ncbi:hypothetical protein [uncultured Roseivirga sp.]
MGKLTLKTTQRVDTVLVNYPDFVRDKAHCDRYSSRIPSLANYISQYH